MILNKVVINGVYEILDRDNTSFPVYCSFGPEPGFVWTLIQSYALKNITKFVSKAFYLHDMPINQDAPEWDSYRLSKHRMSYIGNSSTHWRATCNFSTVEWITEIIFALRWLKWICLLCPIKMLCFVDGMSWSTSGELHARTVQL